VIEKFANLRFEWAGPVQEWILQNFDRLGNCLGIIRAAQAKLCSPPRFHSGEPKNIAALVNASYFAWP
jgi:hypothetical protein